MKNNILTLLYFIGVTIINLYPIYIAVAVVGFVNQRGQNIDGVLEVAFYALGLTVLAIIITVPVYILALQLGQKYMNRFHTITYSSLVVVVLLSLSAWYIYTAVRLY
ncbi:hypothetical protein E3U55_05965 [Filobacillus milosensis]|uniref:Uncharacterized protein n=1 Tax=Filobacillus milosensis TaxID=94137 RepID=A0A4Y8IQH2_9BACI|nr:hypothetical protein [Filobacillus milosensis]TFB22780.1 hypothetical protein E3U55_05965 [Filobacillus milosensis]